MSDSNGDSTSSTSILTAETVPEYLSRHSDKIGVFDKDTKITTKAIIGGNVNYAFRAVDDNNDAKSVFVKQAPEYVAVFGPDGLPLTSKRMEQEIAVYDEWKVILGSDTEYLPKIYHFDSKFSLITLLTYSSLNNAIENRVCSLIMNFFRSKKYGNRHGIPGGIYIIRS